MIASCTTSSSIVNSCAEIASGGMSTMTSESGRRITPRLRASLMTRRPTFFSARKRGVPEDLSCRPVQYQPPDRTDECPQPLAVHADVLSPDAIVRCAVEASPESALAQRYRGWQVQRHRPGDCRYRCVHDRRCAPDRRKLVNLFRR